MSDDPNFLEFFQHYLVCAFWSSTTGENGDEPLDDRYHPRDLDPESRRQLELEARDFFDSQQDLLRAVIDQFEANWGQHGHDFWLTRNHHGAGFWDRGYGELGRRLTDACRPYGDCYLYVGDDGKVYQ